MSFWTGKKVGITGGCGLIGRPLDKQLMAEGARTYVFDSADNHDFDITNVMAVYHWLDSVNPDVLIHLAAVSGVETARQMMRAAFEINVRGTWNVLGAADNKGSIPVVVASSNHVYGPQETFPVNERAPLNQLDTYSVSKICADYIARAYSHNYGLPTCVIRNTNCFGPADPHHDHLIPGTILSILRGEKPMLRSDGETRKDYLYVDDVAEAYILAAQYLLETGQSNVFNVSSGWSYSAREVVDDIAAIMGYTDDVSIIGKPNDQANENMDPTRFCDATGWFARHTLTEALEKTINWFTANHKVEAVA